MARKDRLTEEVKLGGLWAAVSAGTLVAAIGGTARIVANRYPEFEDLIMWAGFVAIVMPSPHSSSGSAMPPRS